MTLLSPTARLLLAGLNAVDGPLPYSWLTKASKAAATRLSRAGKLVKIDADEWVHLTKSGQRAAQAFGELTVESKEG
jgi:hypothetical protein